MRKWRDSDASAAARVTVASVVSVVSVLPQFLTGALAVQLQSDLRFGAIALGVSVASFRAIAAISSAPMGRLADRLGGTRGMRYACLVAATAAAAVAVAATHWIMLAAFLGVGGLANALAQPSANRFVAASVARRRQGLAFGIKQSAQPAASLVGGLAVPVLALTVGWRWSFAAAAAAAALAALTIPRVPRRPRGRTDPSGPRRPPVAWLWVGLALAMVASTPLAAFIVDNAVYVGFSGGAAGLLLTLGSLAAISVRLGAGVMADRRSGGHLRVVALLMFTGSIGYILLATQQSVFMIFGVLVAFGAGWGFHGLFWLAVVRNSPHAPGAATGALLPAGFIGGVVGPIGFGVLIENANYQIAWLSSAAAAVLAGLAVVIGRRVINEFKGSKEQP